MGRLVSELPATLLESGWELALTAAGVAAEPSALGVVEWLPAMVPGTVAQALAAAGRFSLDAPIPLHDRDAWYRLKLQVPPGATLELDGLATLADLWVDGRHLLRSESMFHAHRVPLPEGVEGEVTLHLRFAALTPFLAGKKGRARWRTKLAAPGQLRFVRTTLLGQMAGWCPPVHAVGPWRAVRLQGPARWRVAAQALRSRLEGDTGIVECSLRFEGTAPERAMLRVGEASAALALKDGTASGKLELPSVAKWWPHTHGGPALHAVRVELDGTVFDLGRTGFRTVEVDAAAEGFGLRVNGVPIFCRGACWSATDILSLDDSVTAVDRFLQPARAAGLNLIRVGGTMAYAGEAFFERCDALGLLVWQDFMFANFDYPIADAAFRASVEREAEELLQRTQLSPSLAVLCGGSEVEQQASMLGLPREAWSSALFDELLPAVVRAQRDDVPYVRNAPTGGPLPFQPDRGVTSYYGVGAYLRPLEDSRRANVRFATECLAFANVPDAATLERLPGHAVAPVHHPVWKERVPRDVGSVWDFEDVRDHYLERLYRVKAADLRSFNLDRYLLLSRAVTAEVVFATITEWRRAQSSCRGAVLWMLQDLWPGAGWGIIDSTGRPKSTLHGLARASQPIAVFFSNEGLNGLVAHVANDGPRPLEATLQVRLLREGRTVIAEVDAPVSLAAHQTREFPVSALLPSFLDTTHAYRFGPPACDVAVATLVDVDGVVLSEHVTWPLGFPSAPTPGVNVSATVRGDQLIIVSDRALQSVQVEDPHHRAELDFFHVSPLRPYSLRLLPTDSSGAAPDGELKAITLDRAVRFRAAEDSVP